MEHLQYIPGDPRLVDQLVYELKSKGIFDQFRKECIADVDTRPAYQNLRQRVETSVAMFLSRQCWKPDLNKNQLREKLRKHILEGNYLEQGLERIVDQVVNPKVASVFIPQVEDLVYNYLGIPRKKASEPGSGPTKPEDLLPTDLEAVSPGSVKSNDDKPEAMDTDQIVKMEDEPETEVKEEKPLAEMEKKENMEVDLNIAVKSNDSNSMDKSTIPLPTEEIKLENIPAPINSPPKLIKEVELDDIALPQEPNVSTDIPLPPNKAPQCEKDTYFKPITHNSDDSNSSSDSSLIRNMSPLTPIRNYNNENSCDAQQGFEDDSDNKSDVKVPSSFRFTIEVKDEHNSNSNSEIKKDADKKKTEQVDLSYQFTNQVNLNSYNTPMYDDSSNSNNLHIDYESDINSKTNTEIKLDIENSQDSKKDKKNDDRKSHKSSHRSRDSSRHSNSKDKRSDSKHSTSRDSSRHDKKTSKEDKSKSSKESDKSKERTEKKDRDSSRHHDSSRSSHRSSKDKDAKSHKSSSSSHRHSSKSTDDRKTTSSSKDKASDSSRDKTKDKPRDSKSSSSKSDRDRKSSSNKKSDEKDKKKEKKDIDDHYSSSGRGNHSRRSTDRDSNDGSSSSKGSQNHNGSKSADSKKDGKTSSSKSDNTSTSGESPSPSDKEHIVKDNSNISQFKPIIRVDNHLETPIAPAPRLPFVPDVTLKKPKFAANLQEAKKLMKMRKFLDEEQKRMNQEAALLLEFQANVRPSMSQVYSSISGPELEFACGAPAPDSITFELPSVLNEEEKEDTEMDITPSDTNVSETVAMEGETPDKATENIELKEIQETKNYDSIEEQLSKLDNVDSPSEPDATYDENKPFSELMNEITEYSKASENKSKTDNEETILATENLEEDTENIEIQNVETTDVIQITNSVENKYFEVTIITEELSESEETVFEINSEIPDDEQNTDSTETADSKQITVSTNENDVSETNVSSETVTRRISSSEQEESVVTENETNTEETEEVTPKISDELHYFAEHEKYKAELERQEFNKFLSNFMNTVNTKKKLYLVNCDTYEENIMKEIASATGEFEIINYYKNGHLKVPNITNIVKDVPLSAEVTLPVESNKYIENSILFSPVKSECSFELCNDYDTKLDDINKKSRQEVMEIILGSIVDSSPSKMPTIDYYSDSKDEIEDIDNELKCEIEQTVFRTEVESETESLKRSIDEVESSVNNNRSVLTPKKMRKLSDSDQISSTTEESLELSNNNVPASGRSKYLGRARRPGLARPKRNNLSSSPSSDKSVENYTQNTPPPPIPNGKIKTTPRTKVQRYDTSDLYKPKLHYLSRRHNVS